MGIAWTIPVGINETMVTATWDVLKTSPMSIGNNRDDLGHPMRVLNIYGNNWDDLGHPNAYQISMVTAGCDLVGHP